jgi:hypothetical protein
MKRGEIKESGKDEWRIDVRPEAELLPQSGVDLMIPCMSVQLCPPRNTTSRQ